MTTTAIEDIVLGGLVVWFQYSGHTRMAMVAFVVLLFNIFATYRSSTIEKHNG